MYEDLGTSSAARLSKRSVTLDGHRTSISLEPLFWRLLKEEAERQGKAVAALVTEVDRRRVRPDGGEPQANLSSALRVFLVERLLERTQAAG